MMMMTMIFKESSHLLTFLPVLGVYGSRRPGLGTLCCLSLICILSGGLRTACSQGGSRDRTISELCLVNIANHQMKWLQGCVCVCVCVLCWCVLGIAEVCKLILT